MYVIAVYDVNAKHCPKMINLLASLQFLQFETLGKVQLIPDREFGKEYCFYIPRDASDLPSSSDFPSSFDLPDLSFEKLVELTKKNIEEGASIEANLHKCLEIKNRKREK